ncbi:MAG TPA: hypothetical protein PKJ26_05290 [Candidatus Woesebacteria bacterium]|nr:hypothetical protein [Candidatus Woesebacteria bacterium]HNS65879.1 hypothetical protein [Candidatus Woesebacteria bacterium]
MKAKLLLPIAAVAITAITMYGANQIMAFSGGNQHDALIQKLASTFGKSETEVQTVFNQYRTEQQATREAEFEARLATAVTEGKLTEEQKQLVIAKHAELQAQHEADFATKDSMTREEWQAKRQAEHDVLDSWAESNGIDLSYVMPERGPMGGGKGRGMHGEGFGQGFGQE